jgi:hypothetical protein
MLHRNAGELSAKLTEGAFGVAEAPKAMCQASPTVSNMQAATASAGDFAPRTRKS